MTVQDLNGLSNERVRFSVSTDGVVIRSWTFRYADMIRVSDIESVEISSSSVVRISVPIGTKMGDHEILADVTTGIVTADGKAFGEPMPVCDQNQKSPMGIKYITLLYFHMILKAMHVKFLVMQLLPIKTMTNPIIKYMGLCCI